MKVTLSETRLELDGEPGILYGGEFQYFRIPAEIWERSVQRLKAAEVNFISCYIPWIWHELEEGVFDFQGVTAPERDLIRFLTLCTENDLKLVVRPGPYVYGEYQGFGIPFWFREKHPEALIQYENNLPGKEVALNHSAYLYFVRIWLEQVYHVLQPWLDSDAIVACQIDNETGLPQYGGVSYYGDFNTETVAQYQDYLQDRFQSIEQLNIIWDSDYADFEAVQPPRKADTSAVQFRQWAAFIEDYIVMHLETLKTMLREIGFAPMLYLNDPYLCQWPNQSTKKTRLAPVGFDIYSKFTTDTKSTHDVPYALSFAPEFYRSINGDDRILMGVEVGSGWFDPRVKVRPEATRQKVMISLLRGVRILNYYLLHDCVEADGIPWVFQSPLDKDGEPVPRYQEIKHMGRFVREHGRLLAQSEPLHNAIGLLKYIPQGWDFLRSNYNIWNALDMIDQALTHFTGLTGVHGALLEGGFNPLVHDLEAISLDTLEELQVLIFASTQIMDSEAYQKLVYFVENGGCLISFGTPVAINTQGDPLHQNPLFPARPIKGTARVQYGTNAALSQVALDIMDYQMMRRSHPHKLSLHTLDMMHPFVEFTKYIGTAGTWLQTERAEPFWASRFVSFWQGGGISPILQTPDGQVVGYTKRLGQGRIVFLGTLPGLFFDTPGYYGIEADKKNSVIQFLAKLMRENGVGPLVEPIPNVEVILRQTPENALIMGLINRGPAQDISLQLNMGVGVKSMKPLYNSQPEKDFLRLVRFQSYEGHLSQDAVLVMLLEP